MNGFFRSLAGFGLLWMALDWLMPENEMRPYVELGAELCLMLCMLQAFRGILRGIM